MQVDKLSASALNQYLRCPHEYYLHRHTDKKESKLKDNSKLHTGSMIHEVLERLRYKPNKDMIIPLLNDVNEHYEEYTMTEDEISYYEKILKKWIKTRDFYPIVDIEKGFKIPLKRFHITGFIDVVERLDDNFLRVTDYKTGSYFRDMKDTRESVQLKMYTLACMEEYGVDNIEVGYDQIQYEKPKYMQYTTEELRKFLKYIKSMRRKIKNDTRHRPSPGFNCSWCGYTRYCKTIQNEMSLEGIEKMSLDKLIKKFDVIKGKNKVIQEKKDLIKTMIEERMKTMDIEEYENDNYSVKQIQNKYTNYDAVKVLEYAPIDRLNDIFKVKKSKLKDLDDDIKEKIKESADYRYSSPYVRVFSKD